MPVGGGSTISSSIFRGSTSNCLLQDEMAAALDVCSCHAVSPQSSSGFAAFASRHYTTPQQHLRTKCGTGSCPQTWTARQLHSHRSNHSRSNRRRRDALSTISTRDPHYHLVGPVCPAPPGSPQFPVRADTTPSSQHYVLRMYGLNTYQTTAFIWRLAYMIIDRKCNTVVAIPLAFKM
jgi:hypothetical protein